jgi:hypothetical protein
MYVCVCGLQVNGVISKRVKETRDASEDPIYEPAFPETQKLSMARLAELNMLAEDAEANDQWDTATKQYVGTPHIYTHPHIEDKRNRACHSQGTRMV